MGRIVDLSLTLREGMRGVAFESAGMLTGGAWNAQTLKLYSHAGTHMDAPRHFLDDGATIDTVPLEACIGPARVIDLTRLEPRRAITPEDLAAWSDTIAAGDRLLLNTGWSDHLGRSDYRADFPRVGPELARWLAGRRITLLGVDAPSVANLNDIDELTNVHRTLLAADIVIVEGLANLGALRQEVVQFIALPLKVEGGDGTPVRAVAIEDDAEASRP
jgi:kynurenine formamidase